MEQEEVGIKARILEFIRFLRIPIRSFESNCELSYGFVKNISKGIGADKLGSILHAYPELNQEWLLHGKGEMIKPASQEAREIANSQLTGVNVRGSDISINSTDDEPKSLEALVKIVETYQRTTTRFQDQIDRLLNLLEKK